VEVLHHIGFGVRNFFVGEELAKILQHAVINLKVLGDLLTANVMLGKVEECVVHQQLILEVITLRRFDFYVGRDAAAAVNRASAVGQLYFLVGVVVFDFAVVIVVIERNAAVFALDQASAG